MRKKYSLIIISQFKRKVNRLLAKNMIDFYIKICYIINIKPFVDKFSAKDGGSLNDQDRENLGDEP